MYHLINTIWCSCDSYLQYRVPHDGKLTSQHIFGTWEKTRIREASWLLKEHANCTQTLPEVRSAPGSLELCGSCTNSCTVLLPQNNRRNRKGNGTFRFPMPV